MFEQALKDWIDDLSFTGVGKNRIIRANIQAFKILAGTSDRRLFRANLLIFLENQEEPIGCQYDIMVERFDNDYIVTDWSIFEGQQYF